MTHPSSRVLLEDDEAHLGATHALGFGAEAAEALGDLVVSQRRHQCVSVAHALRPICGGRERDLSLEHFFDGDQRKSGGPQTRPPAGPHAGTYRTHGSAPGTGRTTRW